MFTLAFDHDAKVYNALVDKKITQDRKEYRITIMDGELEKMMYGSHIIVENNGVIEETVSNEANKELLSNIKRALEKQLLSGVTGDTSKHFKQAS